MDFIDWAVIAVTLVFFGIALLYFTVSLTFSALISVKEGFKYLGLLPISFAALHFGYGMGFAHAIIRLCCLNRIRRWKKKPD